MKRPSKQVIRDNVFSNLSELRRADPAMTGAHNRRGVRDYNVEHAINSVLRISNEIKRRGRTVDLLDIGCGAGVFLDEVGKRFGNKVRTVGLDARRDAVNWARQRKHIDEVHHAHASNLSCFPDKSFDLIFSVWGMPRPFWPFMTYLEEATRVLRKGGTLISHITMDLPDEIGSVKKFKNPLKQMFETQGYSVTFSKKRGLTLFIKKKTDNPFKIPEEIPLP